MSEPFLAAGAAAVTPSDTTELGSCRALYIGSAGGNVVVHMPGRNDAITFIAVPIGVLPVSARRVMAATTSTNIVALY